MSEASPIHTSTAEGEKAVAVLQAMKERKLGKLLGESEAYADSSGKALMFAAILIAFATITFSVAPPAIVAKYIFALLISGAYFGVTSLAQNFSAAYKEKEAKKYAQKEGLNLKAEELK